MSRRLIRPRGRPPADRPRTHTPRRRLRLGCRSSPRKCRARARSRPRPIPRCRRRPRAVPYAAMTGLAQPRYTHGHHDSVLRSHRWRTVENSAAYLAPSPACRVHVDARCRMWAGHRSRSTSARIGVAPRGTVIGIDANAIDAAINAGRAAERDKQPTFTNVEFTGIRRSVRFARLRRRHVRHRARRGHQVLQHLGDPVPARCGRCAARLQARRDRRRGTRQRLRGVHVVPLRITEASTRGLTMYDTVAREPSNQAVSHDAGRGHLCWPGPNARPASPTCEPGAPGLVLATPEDRGVVGHLVG